MVVLLVLLTVTVLLLAQWYMVHARKEAAQRASITARAAPDGERSLSADPLSDLFFHPGHSWIRLSDDGEAIVGTSDFASSFAGKLAAIDLPREGAVLRQGDPAWTVVSTRDRRLAQVMPLDGKILEVNRSLLRDPETIQRSPYEDGWVLRVRPRHLSKGLRNLIQGRAARTWMDATRASVTARYSPALGSLAHDGGDWTAGFGDLLPDEDWDELREELFPVA
jgi:glycine cleavage system H lipoate-binding protein